ncbi:MAG: prephenate dehydrogenase [Ruthenibacterium sp.]
MMEQHNFCIVGLGLLGGSYAMGLTRAGCRVTAIDTRAEAIRYAQEHGLIAAGGTVNFTALVGQADAVILALYPGATVDWLRANAAYLKRGALVTDVCGVKRAIVDEIQSFLRPDVEFIASHPMAGREVSGVENADCAMFCAANFIVVPTPKNTPRGIAFARALAQTLGFACITQLTCEEHDCMIGYVSQLTHAIAVSLMNANDNTHLAQYTGDSFRDLTRIARINAPLWRELFLLNRDNLLAEIDQFDAALSDLRAKLAAGDDAGLEALFRQSSERRARFDKKP